MLPFISFVDENNLHYINYDAKVHGFINHDTKEWKLHSISAFFPSNILVDTKAIPIPYSPIDDKIF